MAKLAGLPEPQAHLLKLASPMHDIGKVAIPATILLQPGPLNKKEFELMKTHTSIGYNVFTHSNRELLRMAAIIAHEHHEKWNGTGYPTGLKENEIHIFGRITAIADVFDALTSKRVYKKVWSLEEVIPFLLEQRGKHFDPFLIALFHLHIDTFIDICYKYAAKSENEQKFSYHEDREFDLSIEDFWGVLSDTNHFEASLQGIDRTLSLVRLKQI